MFRLPAWTSEAEESVSPGLSSPSRWQVVVLSLIGWSLCTTPRSWVAGRGMATRHSDVIRGVSAGLVLASCLGCWLLVRLVMRPDSRCMEAVRTQNFSLVLSVSLFTEPITSCSTAALA